MKTTEDWLEQWDDSQTDVKNILDCLNTYVHHKKYTAVFAERLFNTIMPVLSRVLQTISIPYFEPPAFSNSRRSNVKKVILNLNPDHSSVERAQLTGEYILACLKQEMHQYKHYRFIETRYLNEQLPKKDEFVIKFASPYSSNIRNISFDYRVLDFKGQLVHGTFLLKNSLGFVNNVDTLMPYVTEVLDSTSKLGHTRGSGIADADLVTLIDVIELKTRIRYSTLDYQAVLERYDVLGSFISTDSTTAWKKQGDFTQNITHSLFNKSQYYVNTEVSNQIIHSIQLFRLHNNHLAIRVKTPDQETFSKLEAAIIFAELPAAIGCNICNQRRLNSYFYYNSQCLLYDDEHANENWVHVDPVKLKQFFPGLREWDSYEAVISVHLNSFLMDKLLSFIDHTPPAFCDTETNEYTLYVPDSSANNLNLIMRLLEVLLRLEPSTDFVYQDIFTALSIHHPQQQLDNIEVELHDAMAHQEQRRYQPVWHLALACKQDFNADTPTRNLSLEQLIQIFKAISNKNPFFAQANDELVHLIMRIPRNSYDVELLEQTFRYAFKGTAPEITDRLYAELCGDSALKPTIQNIKGDEDILVALATMLRETKTQLNELTPKQTHRTIVSGLSLLATKNRHAEPSNFKTLEAGVETWLEEPGRFIA